MSARVALVTGGARGIGLGIARRLAQDGFELAVCGTREETSAADAIGELRALDREIAYVQADIAQAADRERLIAAVRARFGRLHVLVNNAGVAPLLRADLLEAGEESFDRLLRVNLKGPYFLTQSAARWMIEQQRADERWHGCVVFVTSVSATTVSTNRGDYCLSKAGLAMAAQLWAVRLASHAIPVYEVRPGVVRTDMTAGVAEKYDRLIADGLVPQGRWGEPDDVGRVVAALARGDAPYSTGAVVTVDGGLTIPRL
jgi:NAD(P)-dependent dehydrogenase (short-subunit alcohol dehydrogenase family)